MLECSKEWVLGSAKIAEDKAIAGSSDQAEK